MDTTADQISESTQHKLATIERIFESMQAKIITSLNSFLPENYDFTELEELFSSRINNQMDYGLLILNLLEYFIRVCSENLVKFSDYTILQAQTQKLEAEIRNHIKIQQSVKLYLESKLRSLERYKKEAIERRYQVGYLNERLLQLDDYCRRLMGQVNHNLLKNGRYNSMRSTTIPYEMPEHFKASAGPPPKSPDLIGEEQEESGYVEPSQPHIAEDLQAFRYYSQRVHNIRCDS